MIKTTTILIGVAGSLATLYFLLGSVILSVAIGVILLCSVIFSAFALGSWWSGKLIQSGAQIALQSQISDDKRDIMQVQAIGNLAREMLKFGNDKQLQQQQYLQLPADNSIDGEFEIHGLEN